MKHSFIPCGFPFPLEMSSSGPPCAHFLLLVVFWHFFSPLGAIGPSFIQQPPLGRPQTPTLLLCSVRAVRLCSTKGKKAFSFLVIGAWPAVLWEVKGSQLTWFTWMIELPSSWEAESYHMGSINGRGSALEEPLPKCKETSPCSRILSKIQQNPIAIAQTLLLFSTY